MSRNNEKSPTHEDKRTQDLNKIEFTVVHNMNEMKHILWPSLDDEHQRNYLSNLEDEKLKEV